MTENATAPDTWQNPAKVGLWGPPVTLPPPPKFEIPTNLPDRRSRRSWGIGDIWLGVLAVIVSQIVLLVGMVFIAIANLGPAAAEDPIAVLNEVSEIGSTLTTKPGFVIAALLSQWAAFMAPPIYAARRKGRGSLASTFGLRFKKIDLLIGLGLAASAQVLLGLFANVLIPALGIDNTGSDNTGQVTDSTGVMLIILALGGAIGAPFVEEIFFRGLVLGALAKRFAKIDLYAPADEAQPEVSDRRRKIGIAASVLISSAFFGSVHVTTGEDGQFHTAGLLLLMFQTGFLGAVFACVAVKVRRLGPAIIAHAIFNGTSIGLVLLTT